MDAKIFNEAIAQIAESKNISTDAVIEALKEALKKAYIRSLGVVDGEDAEIKVDIDTTTGDITLGQVKKVVEDVEDDYLQISAEDANEGLKKAKYKAGDDFFIPCDFKEVSKVFAMAVKSVLRQKIGEAERSALYELYKDHIGEMVTGTVEKCDDRFVIVNIGKATSEMGKKDLIGDEYFHVGDQIKVYIEKVSETVVPGKDEKAPKRIRNEVQITRSSAGFLRRLFEEEIREVYDGTVIIKDIAREAGIRSKVSVYSNRDDVDPTGACIGPSGTRIQKVVSQLGNAKDKEKIDIINYSPVAGAYIIEALRPAIVLGVKIGEPDPETGKNKAIAVIKDGTLSVAIGRKAANARLASRLTGYSIDIKEESAAKAEGIEYTTEAEWKDMAAAQKREAEKEAFMAKRAALEAAKAAEEKEEEEVVAPIEESPAPTPEVVEEVVAPAPETVEETAEEVAPAPIEEKKVEEKKVAPRATATAADMPKEAINPAAAALASLREAEAKKNAPVEPTSVKTTTTLSDLEAELNASKEKKSRPANKGKRPRKITEEEVVHAQTPIIPTAQPAVSYYSEEEMAEMAKEDEEAAALEMDDEDIDYEAYDQYYDDDDRK